MSSLPLSLSRAAAQLGDPAILKVLAKSLLITVIIFAALGVLGWQAASRALEAGNVPFQEELGALLGVIVFVLGGWLLFRLVALAVLQFFADEIIAAVEAKYYPRAARSLRKISMREEIVNSARSVGRALIVNLIALPFAIMLLFTGIGTALLFWAVNAWLLGHELQDMVWLRHRADDGDIAPLGAGSRFALGGITAGLLTIPFINFLAPVIGAASAAHMVHGSRRANVGG